MPDRSAPPPDDGSSPSASLRVVLDASALCDARAGAGIGRYVAELVAALQRREDVVVHTAVPRRPPVTESWLVRWMHAQPRVTATVVRHRPQVVHGMSSDAILLVPPRRQVVTVHDVIPWEPGRVSPRSYTARYLAFQRRQLRRCAAIIAVSETVAGEAIERLGLDPERVYVVEHGVNSTFTAQPRPDDDSRRAALGVGPDPYVLWVGSLRARDPRKAIDLLVDAVSTIKERVDLVLAGHRGPEGERVLEFARGKGVKVVPTGYVPDDDLATVYRGAAAVVVPSVHEGFGLPMLEAMACGAPVVAARAGHLEALAAGAAVLVPPGDADALAHGIRDVLDSGDRGRQMRSAGLERAAQFSWDRAAERTVDVYRRVAGE